MLAISAFLESVRSSDGAARFGKAESCKVLSFQGKREVQ